MNAVTQTEARAINSRRYPAGSRRPDQEPDFGSAVAAGAAPSWPQRAQDPAHVHPRTGREHCPRRPAAKPDRHPAADGEHYEVVAGGRRLAALKLLAKKKPHPQGLGSALPAGGRWHRPHRQPHRERAARSHAPRRPVRGIRRAGGRRPTHRGHCRRFRRVPAGGAAPLEAGERLAAPAGRLPRRSRDAGTVDGLAITDDHAAQEAAFYGAPNGSAARRAARAPDRARNRRHTASAGALRRAGHLRSRRRRHPPRPVRGRRCGRVPDRCRAAGNAGRDKLAAHGRRRAAEGWAWVDAVPP
jgi:ParB family chromosome partitioning protein